MPRAQVDFGRWPRVSGLGGNIEGYSSIKMTTCNALAGADMGGGGIRWRRRRPKRSCTRSAIHLPACSLLLALPEFASTYKGVSVGAPSDDIQKLHAWPLPRHLTAVVAFRLHCYGRHTVMYKVNDRCLCGCKEMPKAQRARSRRKGEKKSMQYLGIAQNKERAGVLWRANAERRKLGGAARQRRQARRIADACGPTRDAVAAGGSPRRTRRSGSGDWRGGQEAQQRKRAGP